MHCREGGRFSALHDLLLACIYRPWVGMGDVGRGSHFTGIQLANWELATLWGAVSTVRLHSSWHGCACTKCATLDRIAHTCILIT